MSHLPYRKENNCLNCNTEVIGPFCHHCGQENVEPKETAWHLFTHFFNDLTHFDGKFFSTIKLLIKKPGFLSKEYMQGRRACYLNPVRMYFLTSATFFFIFFLAYKGETTFSTNDNTEKQTSKDSIKYEIYKKLPNKKLLSREEYFKHQNQNGFSLAPGTYGTKANYDSLLKSGKKHHNWVERQLVYKSIELNAKYHNDGKEIFKEVGRKLLHSLPQMFFFTLPIFAVLLKLFYFRRKSYYYTDHAIFTIHFFTFLFIASLAIFGINGIASLSNLPLLYYISFAISLFTFFYFYKALRNFYKQGRAKTILKFFLLFCTSSITMLFLFIIFFFLSIFEI